MKAPREMWVHGVKYAEGDTIPKEDTRTAKMLIELADSYPVEAAYVAGQGVE